MKISWRGSRKILKLIHFLKTNHQSTATEIPGKKFPTISEYTSQDIFQEFCKIVFHRRWKFTEMQTRSFGHIGSAEYIEKNMIRVRHYDSGCSI